jgi:ribonuclease-3
MEEIEKILGYKFQSRQLLQQALTHSSITRNEHKNYERLEFLGDRILSVCVAAMLYQTFPNDKEGELSRRHVKMVCAQAVAEVVKKLHLQQYIKAQDALTTNILCDVGEAIIGAIFVDSNIENAMDFVKKNWVMLIDKDYGTKRDAKTALQEQMQANKKPLPIYEIVDKKGSEHEPIFIVKVLCFDGLSAVGSGSNKKAAEQQAAEKMLKILPFSIKES